MRSHCKAFLFIGDVMSISEHKPWAHTIQGRRNRGDQKPWSLPKSNVSWKTSWRDSHGHHFFSWEASACSAAKCSCFQFFLKGSHGRTVTSLSDIPRFNFPWSHLSKINYVAPVICTKLELMNEWKRKTQDDARWHKKSGFCIYMLYDLTSIYLLCYPFFPSAIFHLLFKKLNHNLML